MTAFALFDTAIGRCAIAWHAHGIVGVLLPQHDDAAMRTRIRRRYQDAREQTPSADVSDAIRGIQRLLAGERPDLNAIHLDMTGVQEFDQRVYIETRAIAPGQTTTYGAIATRLGDLSLSRAVGQALGRNPFAIIVPCHRVLAAGDKSGGFSAVGGVETKRRMLEIEGARALHPRLPLE